VSRSRPLSLEIVGTDISRLAMWALPFGSGVVGGKLRTRAVEVEWFGDLVFGEILCFGGTRVRCRVLESCCRNSKKSVCRCKIVANRSAIILAPAYRPFFEFLGCSRTFRGWLLDPLWWSYVPKLDAPSATVYLFPLTSKTLLLSYL